VRSCVLPLRSDDCAPRPHKAQSAAARFAFLPAAWRNSAPAASRARAVSKAARKPVAPKIGFVSLGCPKALVDSERILSQLRAEGYETAADYAGADVVVINTCGFLDSARAESLDAIGEALAENGRVIVTGCLGAEANVIRDAHPNV